MSFLLTGFMEMLLEKVKFTRITQLFDNFVEILRACLDWLKSWFNLLLSHLAFGECLAKLKVTLKRALTQYLYEHSRSSFYTIKSL